MDKPEPIRTLKRKGVNGEAPPPKPRVVLPPEAPVPEQPILVGRKAREKAALAERMAADLPKRPARPPKVDRPKIVDGPTLEAVFPPVVKSDPDVLPVIRQAGDPEGTVYTREGWLLAATDKLRPLFAEAGETIPPVRVSIGWMGGRGSKKGVIGQCWSPSTVADGLPAVFLIPTLKDPVDILGVLTHELVHASGHMHHRGSFSKAAGKVGLEAPWTSTKPSAALLERLTALAAELGPFDHGQVRGGTLTGGDGPKVQTTRMLKVSCPDDGYTLRATSKWLDQAVPACPLCEGPMTVEAPKGE